VPFLPFIQNSFNHISKVLTKHNIKMIGLPLRKMASFLRPIKDNPGLKTSNVHGAKVYVRQAGHFISTRVNEHHHRMWLYQPEKSAMAEHSTDLGHCILLNKASILAKMSRHRDWLIWEAMETELCPNKNGEDGFSLGRSWKAEEKELEVSLKEKTSHFLLNNTPLPRPSMGENRDVFSLSTSHLLGP
jgi:hypothetical protein